MLLLLPLLLVLMLMLDHSNIMAEWLSTAKHNRVYLPEEPFVHGALQVWRVVEWRWSGGAIGTVVMWWC